LKNVFILVSKLVKHNFTTIAPYPLEKNPSDARGSIMSQWRKWI